MPSFILALAVATFGQQPTAEQLKAEIARTERYLAGLKAELANLQPKRAPAKLSGSRFTRLKIGNTGYLREEVQQGFAPMIPHRYEIAQILSESEMIVRWRNPDLSRFAFIIRHPTKGLAENKRMGFPGI